MARFSFHRGTPALDFTGTVGHRASSREERLPDAGALAAWLREAGFTGPGVKPASHDLEAAHALREAIARMAEAVVTKHHPARRDIAIVNAAAAQTALLTPVLDPRTLRVRWHGEHVVRGALGRVAADAVDLFATRRSRLVRCELDGCGAFLLSASRGAPRRWCSMEACGNVAKVAAHRARARAGMKEQSARK